MGAGGPLSVMFGHGELEVRREERPTVPYFLVSPARWLPRPDHNVDRLDQLGVLLVFGVQGLETGTAELIGAAEKYVQGV